MLESVIEFEGKARLSKINCYPPLSNIRLAGAINWGNATVIFRKKDFRLPLYPYRLSR